MTKEVLHLLCSSSEVHGSEDDDSKEPEDGSKDASQDGDEANMETISDLCEVGAEMEEIKQCIDSQSCVGASDGERNGAWTGVDEACAKSEVKRLEIDNSVLRYSGVMWDSLETGLVLAASNLSYCPEDDGHDDTVVENKKNG